MTVQPKTERGDYQYRKEKTLDKVAETLEECLGQFHGEENNRIREDIANYIVDYLGVSFGLHSTLKGKRLFKNWRIILSDVLEEVFKTGKLTFKSYLHFQLLDLRILAP